MGKRAEIFGRFQRSFKNLWKETIKDIVRDFTVYLLKNPHEEGIWGGESDNLYTIFWIGEGGNSYTRDQVPERFFEPIIYQEGDLIEDLFIFKCCARYPHILNDVLSEESRVDIKLIIDRYFNSIEQLAKKGGITKVKHLYPYLATPVMWAFKDASVKKVELDPNEDAFRLEHIWDYDKDETIKLFGEGILERKKYVATVVYEQNKKKVTATVIFWLDFAGLEHFLTSETDDNNS